MVAGEFTSTEQRSVSGGVGIAQIPVLNGALAAHTTEKDESEMLVIVTPHIISMAETQSSEIWMTGVK